MELGNSDSGIVHLSDQDVSFVTSLVGEDGVMVLKLVGANSSELLVRDVVCGISRMARGGTAVPGQIFQQQPAAQPHCAPSAPSGVYPSIETEKAAP